MTKSIGTHGAALRGMEPLPVQGRALYTFGRFGKLFPHLFMLYSINNIFIILVSDFGETSLFSRAKLIDSSGK